MAKDLNNGERLLSSILDNARAEAEALLAKAKADADATASTAEAQAARIQQDAEAKSQAAKADVLERSRTNADLDSRKHDLALRRAVVDEAFQQALSDLTALKGPEREALLCKLLLENAEGGETVLPALVDEAPIQSLLDGVNAKLQQAGKAPLKMGAGRQGISGGFILSGPSYELNCTFEAILRDLREAEESSVAKILFG